MRWACWVLVLVLGVAAHAAQLSKHAEKDCGERNVPHALAPSRAFLTPRRVTHNNPSSSNHNPSTHHTPQQVALPPSTMLPVGDHPHEHQQPHQHQPVDVVAPRTGKEIGVSVKVLRPESDANCDGPTAASLPPTLTSQPTFPDSRLGEKEPVGDDEGSEAGGANGDGDGDGDIAQEENQPETPTDAFEAFRTTGKEEPNTNANVNAASGLNHPSAHLTPSRSLAAPITPHREDTPEFVPDMQLDDE